ncbi:ChbG/HpnK family deacetylase [Streptomyces sp. NPDC051985]|uniref:ChbG/HpnK family deacetylase n=1 Tax=Streptomyces sp. NPDC051985 TaxID=3155807 RepID=UPI003436DDB6
MYPAINTAVIESVEEGVANSCSLMVLPPAAKQAMDLLSRRPQVPFRIHLTLVSDFPSLPWEPLTARVRVSTLLDPARIVPTDNRRTGGSARPRARSSTAASPDDIRLEDRAEGRQSRNSDGARLAEGAAPALADGPPDLVRAVGSAVRSAARGRPRWAWSPTLLRPSPPSTASPPRFCCCRAASGGGRPRPPPWPDPGASHCGRPGGYRPPRSAR